LGLNQLDSGILAQLESDASGNYAYLSSFVYSFTGRRLKGCFKLIIYARWGLTYANIYVRVLAFPTGKLERWKARYLSSGLLTSRKRKPAPIPIPSVGLLNGFIYSHAF